MNKIATIVDNRREAYCLMYDGKFLETFVNMMSELQVIPQTNFSHRYLYTNLEDAEEMLKAIVNRESRNERIKKYNISKEITDLSRLSIVKVVSEKTHTIYER